MRSNYFCFAALLSVLFIVVGCPTGEGGDDDDAPGDDDDTGDDDTGDDDTTAAADADGDGHDETVDCDDNDPLSYPGADEQCDGVDNDCDEVVPDDEIDDDGDGFAECEGDCDDDDDAVHPDAEEVCDLIDNDCDGSSDPFDETDADGDGDPACSDCDDADEDLETFDADGDGYSTCAGDCDDGDAALNLDDSDSDGYSTCAGDCDDGSAAIAPHAIEIPGDGTDDNCDGLDYCEDLNCDGWADLVFTNFRDDATNYEIDSYVYWGSASGYSAADRTPLPTNGAAGASVADLNGDGYLEIVFSNHKDNASYLVDSIIYWGGAAGFSTQDSTPLPTTGAFRNAVADLDGDGYLEIVFTSYHDNNDYTLDSIIYWGSAAGFSSNDRTDLPTIGAHDLAIAGPGVPVLSSIAW